MNQMAITAISRTPMTKRPKKTHSSQRRARMAATTLTICTTILSLPSSLASMVKPSEAAIERRPEIRNSRPTMMMATHTLTMEGISCTRAMYAAASQVPVYAVRDRGQNEQPGRQTHPQGELPGAEIRCGKNPDDQRDGRDT